ncbi:hypothetical protein D3C77_209720 [compost metagenome]
MVEQALNPLAADFAVRAVGQDRSVLHRDVHLVIEPVGDPALDLLAAGAALIHRYMVGVMDVVVRTLGAQGLLEFGRGHRRCVAHLADSCNAISRHDAPPVGAGLPREACTVAHGTGFAGVRGTSPLLQRPTARCSCRRRPLRRRVGPARRARPSLHRGSGWCC